jgi:hypothetical protein
MMKLNPTHACSTTLQVLVPVYIVSRRASGVMLIGCPNLTTQQNSSSTSTVTMGIASCLSFSRGKTLVAPRLTATPARGLSGSDIKVDGYSRTKGLGNGKYTSSQTFDVGGHSWCLLYICTSPTVATQPAPIGSLFRCV